VILIALGANLPSHYGSPQETLEAAVLALDNAGINVVARSNIWVTEPVPVSDQPLYRNAVVQVHTKLEPKELLTLLHSIEADFGRVRHERNEARVLDLDLLSYNDVVIHEEGGMQIPHPRMHERAFVLIPISEVSQSWIHPVLQKTADELLDILPDQSFKSTMKKSA